MIMSIKCKATGRYIKPLTKRQDEIYALVKKNMTDTEISDVLGISASTVNQHVYMICDKLKLSCREDIVKHEGE